jgi:signal transduction histidine kinase/CheY-like chemotaxis protein/HPt (histidine-containing phosphotransfer) domain-containing protein
LLEAALADENVRAIVASGDAGIGKSAFLDCALRQRAAGGALTGSGKHVEDAEGDDLAPLITAIEQAVTAGLDQLYDPDAGLAMLAAAVGPYAAAFSQVGSGLLRGLAARSRPMTMTPEASDERIIQAAIAVLRWLEGFNQPIFLLIDDWGRASNRAALRYARLLRDPATPRLRLLATERPHEPSTVTAHVKSVTIEMSPLAADAMQAVLIDILDGDSVAATGPILDFLPIQGGVVFDMIQAVQLLISSRALVRDDRRWRFDSGRAAGALGDSLADSIVARLATMSPSAVRLAHTLAVFGDSALRSDLSVASELPSEQIPDAIDQLVQDGIVRTNGDELVLTHDRIRGAILAAMDAAMRRRTAGGSAEALRKSGVTPADGVRGTAMLSLRLQGGLGEVGDVWAALFADGAREARGSGDGAAATMFAEAALALSERTGAVSFAVLTEAVLGALQQADHTAAQSLADRLVQVAADPREMAEADEIRVFTWRMSGDLDKALDFGLEAARRMGVSVPARPSQAQVLLEAARIMSADPVRARKASALSEAELAVIGPIFRVSHAAGTLLHERNARQAVILGSRVMKGPWLSGTTLGSSVASFVCSLTGAYARAARWAEVSDALQSPAQPLRASSMQNAIDFGHWYVRPLAETARRNDEVEALAYAEGDLAAAGYANRNRVLDSLFLAQSLAEVEREAQRGLTIAQRLQDKTTRPIICAVLQMIENLTRPCPTPSALHGAHYQGDASAQAFADSESHLNNLYRPIAAIEALLADVFGDYELASRLYARRRATFDSNIHHPRTPLWIFPTALALYRTGRKVPRRYLAIMRRVARLNPYNHRRRMLLLDAEKARLAGRRGQALDLYESAAAAAQASDCLLDRGLIGQAAAEGATMLQAPGAARGYQEFATEAWEALGATHLMHARGHRISVLEAPILQQELDQLNAQYEFREVELSAARDAAERANRAKSRLLASVGHELRTPLQGIAGLVELAELESEPVDLKVLRGAVDQLSTVVGDLTDLGALDGGGISLTSSSFDPQALIASVAGVHEPSLAGTTRRIVQSLGEKRYIVLGDEGRVRQILSNLIGNAVKHGEGDVTIRLLAADERVNSVGLTVEVSDEGPGLSNADVVRLFEPFERGQAADRVAGLGLGLSIARRLAQAMDGDLTAHGAPGEGATFRVRLDLPRAPNARAASARPSRAVRVLLAEDTALSRRVLAALLRADGALVEDAENGEAALSLALRIDFDLIILDMRMPGRDGLAVAEAIRGAQARNCNTPIAIITASSSEDIAGRSMELGLNAVLQKPIGRAGLRRLLDSVESGRWALEAASFDPEDATVDRLAEFREALGPAEAGDLFVQVRPNILSAIDRIEAALRANETGVAVREVHRLMGLASHFGLVSLTRPARALEELLGRPSAAVSAEDAPMQIAVLQEAARDIDWTAFSEIIT